MDSNCPNPLFKEAAVVFTDVVKHEVVPREIDGAQVTRMTPQSQAEVKPAKNAKAFTQAEPKPETDKAVAAVEKATHSKTKKTAALEAGDSSASEAASPPVASKASVVAGGKKYTKPAFATDKDAASRLVHKPARRPASKGAVPAVEALAKVVGSQRKASSKTAPGLRVSTSVRSLGVIRQEAQSTVSDLRTFCLRPESKVIKKSGLQILDQANTLYQLAEERLFRNSYFEGQLASVHSNVKRSQAAVDSVVRKRINARYTSSPLVMCAATYTEKVTVDASSSMVRIFPPKGKEQDSNGTKRTILSIVKPAQS